MSTFNRNGVVAALVGALALLSGCGSAQSTSMTPNSGSFGITPGTGGGGGSAVGCIPLNPQSTVIGVQASGYLSPLVQESDPMTGAPRKVSYGINYNQVTMTSVAQGFSYRFFTANSGDGLYLRFPDSINPNSARIPVARDTGVVVIGPQTAAVLMGLVGVNSGYGMVNSGACISAIHSIWAFGTQGADIVGPKVLLSVQGPAGVRQFEMYGF
jgi:hypothetical protein